MGRKAIQLFDDWRDGVLSVSGLGSQWSLRDPDFYPVGGLFASVGQMGMNFGVSPNSPNRDASGGGGGDIKLPHSDLLVKYVSSAEGVGMVGLTEEEGVLHKKKKKKLGLKLKVKVRNPSLRRLISGGIAGAVSRTAVAPLETIRTHLMVGSSGHSSTEVFHTIMKTDGWKGLFRGNLVNVIRVAPSKAIEVIGITIFSLRFGYMITSYYCMSLSYNMFFHQFCLFIIPLIIFF